MALINENIRSLIINKTNDTIGGKLRSMCDVSNMSTMEEFINVNSMYYMRPKTEDSSDNLRQSISCVLFDKPLVEKRVDKEKTRGRPKKPDVDKLMTSIMVLIEKYVEKESTQIMETLEKRFNVDEQLIEQQSNVNVNVMSQKKGDDNSTQSNKTNTSSDGTSDITDALLKASTGISIENAKEIQQKLEEISLVEEDDLHIEVSEIIIKDNKYYIDENQNLYNIDSEEIIGKFDKPNGVVIKIKSGSNGN
mgnify:CR=1 FL=1